MAEGIVIRVIVVDDHDMVRKGIAAYLKGRLISAWWERREMAFGRCNYVQRSPRTWHFWTLSCRAWTGWRP